MAISRRRALQIAAGAGVVAAVPAVNHIRWNAKDFTREDYLTETAVKSPGKQWRNWSGIERATPQDILSPASEDELASLVGSTKTQIRPVGSGHSFTGLVPSDGTIIDMGRLSGLYAFYKASQTATFGAGTRLRHAAKILSDVGMGFPNLPDIDVQTLAGSFSTGTHGTGKTLTAIHDYVSGFRLITANGEILDVTHESHPELFAAGKVSLGALGIVTQYSLNVVPKFNLTRKLHLIKTNEIIDQIYELADSHRNFEILPLPNTGYSVVITHDIFDGDVEGREPNQDDAFIHDMEGLRSKLGWWPWLRRKAFNSYVSSELPKEGPAEQSTDEYWRLLATSRPTKFNEIEYHIPMENGLAAIKAINEIMNKRPDAFYPIELRFTAQDDAWLSPFNDGVRCSIAVHAPVNEPYEFMFSVIEPVMRKFGGRPHWGKLHSLKKDDLLALYPRFGDFLELRKDIDPQGKFLNSYLGGLFGESFDA